MTFTLPGDIEREILDEVHTGHFASVGEALSEAWREYRRQRPAPSIPTPTAGMDEFVPLPGDGLIGALREDAELLDQIVEEAMKIRESRPWRLAPDE